ncbi:hypothetical protein ACS0TY_033282 [Phlomoides rotata]
MSFTGGKRPFYPTSLTVLLVISLLHIWVFPAPTEVGAIRIFRRSMEEAAPAPAKTQTQIFKEYFNKRVSDLNTTAGNGTYADYKRRIPSCPDPLHN